MFKKTRKVLKRVSNSTACLLAVISIPISLAISYHIATHDEVCLYTDIGIAEVEYLSHCPYEPKVIEHKDVCKNGEC